MRIQLTTGTTTLNATLNGSTAADDFAAMLPLTFTLSDFHATEKVADLLRKLSTAGSPSGAVEAAWTGGEYDDLTGPAGMSG